MFDDFEYYATEDYKSHKQVKKIAEKLSERIRQSDYEQIKIPLEKEGENIGRRDVEK